MFDKMFNQLNLIETGLQVASKRQEVIAHNVANADTPNYKAQRVEFEDYFREAVMDGGSGFHAKKTNARHISFGVADDRSEVSPFVVTDTNTAMRMDGNNVDIDQQMVEQAKNTIQYYRLAGKATAEITRLRMAIREGK